MIRVTGAPPESTVAPATPAIDTGAPSLVAVTDTVAGTVTAKATLQSLPAAPQAGSARVRRPPEIASMSAVTFASSTGGHTGPSRTWGKSPMDLVAPAAAASAMVSITPG